MIGRGPDGFACGILIIVILAILLLLLIAVAQVTHG